MSMNTNIRDYTNEELYGILDLDSPSDRELEARIIFLINKYNVENGDKNLATFFSSIYDHFFQESESESESESEYHEQTIHENFETKEQDQQSLLVTQEVVDDVAENDESNINIIKSVNVSDGVVNPLSIQTVKRIMSIDSQYRGINYPNSTDFTFNLSEPLKDVVALRLYSISIPYTWYTVNEDFGSNFIWLKGNVPGINNGDYEYKFELDAGNYTANELVNEINNSINDTKESNTDVSFGSTKITYNNNSSKSQFIMDIEKNYNELSYYIYFPSWTSPNDPTPNDPINPGQRFLSIPGFLGFNNDTYYINTIKSAQFSPQSNDVVRFTIDDTNNTFTIIIYEGPDEYNQYSTIEYTIPISITNGSYSRNTLTVAINNELENNVSLTSETNFYKTIVDQTNNQSFFSLQIYFNRNNVYLTPNSAVHINFPNESEIWTGTQSCFRFETRNYELNNIIGETPIIAQEEDQIVVDRNLYIEIKCINTIGYGNSSNDYIVNIPNSDIQGYTLNQFVNAFNIGLNTTISNHQTINNPDGEIIRETSGFSLLDDSKVKFQLDILKTFNNNDYHGDVSNSLYGQSFLTKILNLTKGTSTGEYIDGSFVDLGTTNTFVSQFPTSNQYVVDTSFVLALYPTSNGNNNANPYIVNVEESLPIIISDDVSYHSFPILLNNAIDDIPPLFNYLFQNFTDDDGDKVISNCTLSIIDEGNQGFLTASLTINVEKYLTETEYSIQFFDPSLSQGQVDISNTYYIRDLEFKQEYIYDPLLSTPAIELSDIYDIENGYSTDILSSDSITVNQITITENNNTIQLIPHESGVITNNNENDIIIQIPQNTYNRSELIAELNNQLQNNDQLINSEFTIIQDTTINKEYIRFHTNVLKQYTASDFKLEFYSENAFTSCYATASSTRSATFDSTLGWLLGFRNRTIYELNDDYIENYKKEDKIISITSDTTVTVDLYDKLFIVIDDYNQNRLNDGLITNDPIQEISTLPSYALRNSILCDPNSESSRVSGIESVNNNRLTERQLFSINAINSNQSNDQINANRKLTPYSKDTFAMIPIKVNTLSNGEIYSEFGGTLQNQERIYFGPVNIKRMTVKLMTDRGDPINLNGSNWSLSLIAEQLYQSNTQ